MNKTNRIISLFVLGILSVCPACNWFDDDEEENDELFSVSAVVSNANGGSLEKNGYEVSVPSGAIPKNGNNTNASVTFSIERTPEVENPLPSYFQALSPNYIKVGPEAFNFAIPLMVYFPIGDHEVSDIAIVKYDDLEGGWFIQPFCDFKENPRRVGIANISLGTYALIKNPCMTNIASKAEDSETKYGYLTRARGGVLLEDLNTFFEYPDRLAYCITVKAVIQYKYQEQSRYYSFSSNSIIASSGNDRRINNLAGFLPQGEYDLQISCCTKPYPNEWRTYQKTIRVKIDRPAFYSPTGQYYDLPDTPVDDVFHFRGLYPIYLQELGTYKDWPAGKPSEIPAETETVGTGKFQATLTWANTGSSATDLDLHLYGPGDLHVYYRDQTPSGAAFNLDRDWRRKEGNAIENIYSINDTWPKGEYKIVLKHYSGSSPKGYNVRILLNGKVKNHSGKMASEEEKNIYTFKVQ